MPPMRYSAPWLWLKYVNREPKVAGMFLGLLFGAMLSPFAVIAASQVPYWLDSQTVQGTVVTRRQASLLPLGAQVAVVTPLFAHGKHGPRYLIGYEFLDIAGTRYTGEGSVSFSVWTNTKPGDSVTVRYMHGNPARNKLESAVWDYSLTIPFGLLSVAILIGSVWQGGCGIRWVNRQVWLVRSGEAVPGRITRAVVERRGKRRSDVVSVLEYEYAAPEQVTGKVEMRGKPRPNWQTGGGLVILVDPIDPASHAPDIFDARCEDRDHLFGAARP